MTKTTNEPDLILMLQKELGSVVGLPDDMQHVKNAMTILNVARKIQRSRLSTLEAAVEEREETIKKLRNGLFGMLASHGYVEGSQGEPENCDCRECATANSLLQATAPKVQS